MPTGRCYTMLTVSISTVVASTVLSALNPSISYGQRPPDPISAPEQSVHESVIVFSVLYSVSFVASLVLFYFERSMIKPVILDHAARGNNSDFSAVQVFSGKFNINERIQLSTPVKEKVLWADVSLIVAPVSHLLFVMLNFACGFALIGITHASQTQLDLMFLLLLILFLGFAYIGIALRQVIGKRHFRDIYAITETRLVIINFSPLNCRKPAVEFIPFQDIADVKLFIGAREEVGSITFRKKTAKEGSILGRGQYESFFRSWDDSYRELLNIVNPREVETLLLRNISQGRNEGTKSGQIGYQEL